MERLCILSVTAPMTMATIDVTTVRTPKAMLILSLTDNNCRTGFGIFKIVE